MYITILVKLVYWYISQVSGERLQDHWSSGYYIQARNNVLFILRTCFPDELCHWYKRTHIAELKTDYYSSNYTFTYFCSNLFRTSHLYLPGKTRPTCQELTSDVSGMCRGLTLVHVHANY